MAKQPTLTDEETEDQPELPEEWKWGRIGNIVLTTQSGFACPKKYEVVDGIPHLRPNNIGFWGKLDLSKLVRIPKKMVNLQKYGLKTGDVLFNNTNSKELVGRAVLIKEKLNYGFSNHITRLKTDSRVVRPEWLTIALNFLWSKGYFLKHCRKWIGQAGVNTTMLKLVRIPLPPLEEQIRIVTRVEELESRAEEAKRLRKQAKEEAEQIMQAALHKIFSRAGEKGLELLKLKEICRINPSKTEIKNLPDDLEVTFVPMSAVNEVTGAIETPKVRLLGEVRKGYTYFKEGDVLFAKITPCMENGKSAVARNLINKLGFGSTEFHVLRPTQKTVPEWIYYFIRQKSFREEAERNMTGSVGQQRVPAYFLKNVKIPLPPIEEQKKLVAYLDKTRETIESLKKLQQKTEEELEKLIPTILNKTFLGEL